MSKNNWSTDHLWDLLKNNMQAKKSKRCPGQFRWEIRTIFDDEKANNQPKMTFPYSCRSTQKRDYIQLSVFVVMASKQNMS